MLPWRARKLLDRIILRAAMFHRPMKPVVLRAEKPLGSLLAVGDIALVGQVIPEVKASGPASIVQDVLPVLRSVDLRIGNLESILTSEERAIPDGVKPMKSPPEMVSVLREAGIDAVTLANNHSRDYRLSGLGQCKEILRNAGIAYCGAGESRAESLQALKLEIKGVRIGMLGFCDNYRIDPAVEENVTPASPDDRTVEQAIRSLRPSVDLLILQVHWGYEFELYPPKSYRDRARSFADRGADLVLCHHAHVPMGLEQRGKSVIAHGLGNFIFPPGDYLRSGHPWTDRGLMLRITFDRAGVIAAEPIPCHMEGGRVMVSSGAKRAESLGALSKISAGLSDDAKLERIEKHRTVWEALEAVQGLTRAASDADVTGWSLRLQSPFRQAMIASLAREFGNEGIQVANLLRLVAECGQDPSSIAAMMDLVKEADLQSAMATLVSRYQVSEHLPGRLP